MTPDAPPDAPQFGYPTEKSFEHPNAIPTLPRTTAMTKNQIQKLITIFWQQRQISALLTILGFLENKTRNYKVGKMAADAWLTEYKRRSNLVARESHR